MVQRLRLEAISKSITEEQGSKRSLRVAGDPTWLRVRTAGRIWVCNSLLIRLGLGDAKEAPPPYCEQRLRCSPGSSERARNHAHPRPTRLLGAGIWAAPSLSRYLKPCAELHASLVS